MRIAISVISNRTQSPFFVNSLSQLLLDLPKAELGIEKIELQYQMATSLLSQGRQRAITLAREKNCTHLLYVDDDMAAPPWAVSSLISRKVPVIGANYVRKTNENINVAIDLNHARFSSYKKTGIEEILVVGMGLFLIDLDVIENIPAPHFEVLWNKEEQQYYSEDYYFCLKLRNEGVKVYVDHDASQGLGHVGEFIFTDNNNLAALAYPTISSAGLAQGGLAQ